MINYELFILYTKMKLRLQNHAQILIGYNEMCCFVTKRYMGVKYIENSVTSFRDNPCEIVSFSYTLFLHQIEDKFRYTSYVLHSKYTNS